MAKARTKKKVDPVPAHDAEAREAAITDILRVIASSPGHLQPVFDTILDHPFFVGCQFHPELKSTVERPAPLFVHFITAAKQYAESKNGKIKAEEKKIVHHD